MNIGLTRQANDKFVQDYPAYASFLESKLPSEACASTLYLHFREAEYVTGINKTISMLDMGDFEEIYDSVQHILANRPQKVSI